MGFEKKKEGESLPLAARVSEGNSVVSNSERTTPSAGDTPATPPIKKKPGSLPKIGNALKSKPTGLL
jgi:hypothetical protein